MCTLWISKNLAKLQGKGKGKVMCKFSYYNEEELKTKKKRVVLPASDSSSQVTNPKTSPSSSTSQREVSTTLFPASPRSVSPRRSQALEERSTAWTPKDEAAARRNNGGGSTPRTILKRGKLKRRVTIGSSTLSNSSGSGNVEEPDWPPFADEDYIVFCFEEDGAFHVMEDSPQTTSPKLRQCEEHGKLSCACSDEKKDVNHLRMVNRRDCLLPNKQAEEEISGSPLSRKLHQDGTDDASDLELANSAIMVGNELSESMECRNGSVESTGFSHFDDEEQFQIDHNPQVEQSSFSWNLISQDGNMDDFALPAIRGDYYLTKTDVAEEEMMLSPKTKLGMMISFDELLKGENDVSSIESDQSSGFSVNSRGEEENELEGNEEVASESAKSSVSNQSDSSTNSFEFPVLEWAWVGSPVTWPRSGQLHFRKHKSRPASCLKCCKFKF